ncbi:MULTISPECIES: AMP-binding protein [unclassified Marinovum]
MTGPMMRGFAISDTCEVLTPDTPGIAALIDGVRRGLSLRVSQRAVTATVTVTVGIAPYLFCETSGSTGAPKVIRRRPESWQRSFEVNAEAFQIGPADRYATFGQLGHSLSLYGVLEAMHIGADVAALAGRSPRRQLRFLSDQRITVLYATPTQLRLVLRAAEAEDIPALPDMRRIFCGGGTLDPALWQALAGLFPQAELREFFGASETSFITMSDADTPPGSVGRAYPGVQLRIAAAPHETGEIEVAGPYLFDGYDGHPARSNATVRIGEMGYLDGEGFLFLRGRKSRMVTVADRNVFPEEIERVIAALPGVVACAVVPRLDLARGHRLVGFVQGDAQDRDMRSACRVALGAQAVPHRFVRLDPLPLLPAGKPDLQALARMAEELT